MRIDLKGNIKSIGRVYLTASRNPQYGRRLVQRLITVETNEPWRRGEGWGILLLPHLILGVGTWEPDEAPNWNPEAREAMEHAREIPRWHLITRLDLAGKSASHDDWTIIPMEEAS